MYCGGLSIVGYLKLYKRSLKLFAYCVVLIIVISQFCVSCLSSSTIKRNPCICSTEHSPFSHIGCSQLNRLALSGHHLKALNLSRCRKLVDASICAPRLQLLNLAQCEMLEELEIGKSFPCLEQLNIYGCSRMTTAGDLDPHQITSVGISESDRGERGDTISKDTLFICLCINRQDLVFRLNIGRYFSNLSYALSAKFALFASREQYYLSEAGAVIELGSIKRLQYWTGLENVLAGGNKLVKLSANGCLSLRQLYVADHDNLEDVDISGCQSLISTVILSPSLRALRAQHCKVLLVRPLIILCHQQRGKTSYS